MTSGRRYNCVSVDFWRRLNGLSEDARTCSAYLLTNAHTRAGGLYPLPLCYAAADLGWPESRVREALDELVAAGAVWWDVANELVFITDWHRHDLLANPSAALSAVRLVLGEHRTAPDSPAVQAAARALVPEVERVLNAASAEGRQRATLSQLLPELRSATGHRVHTVTAECGHGQGTSARVGSGRLGVGPDSVLSDESHKKGERIAERRPASPPRVPDDAATRPQLDMLTDKAMKRGLRLPDVCKELHISIPIRKSAVNRILSHLDTVPSLSIEERAARQVAAEFPAAWDSVKHRLDAGNPNEAKQLLMEASPEMRERLKKAVAEYLNRDGGLLDAMFTVGANHDTLARDLPLVWAELERRSLGSRPRAEEDARMPA